MPDSQALKQLLERIDGSGYGAYRRIRGTWDLERVQLLVDWVQGDPYASPSRIRLRTAAGIDPDLVADGAGRVAVEDWLLRRFVSHLTGEVDDFRRSRRTGRRRSASRKRSRGTGRSGEIRVYRPGPEVLARSALRLLPDGTAEVRLSVGLPARGRRILGHQAWALLRDDLAEAASWIRPDTGLEAHVRSVRRQRALRERLGERGLVAFIADGAVLPRASGIHRGPLPDAVPFRSPDSMRVTLPTPYGEVQGMGIPEGVTLIAGGGFHGKSTVLEALQWGHLDHVPGDGREQVVAHPATVKIRAEDGRRVAGVDISAFLRDLPGGRSTAPFHTDDASGSTSQAAALVEALESGARVLLLDEDTSATNLLTRDERMRALVPPEAEPIIPLVERVRELHDRHGISTVMVVGGVGDYLDVAHQVIAMEAFLPRDATARARELAGARPRPPAPMSSPAARIPLRQGLEPEKIRTRDERRIQYGGGELELSAVEQVLDPAQAGTLGRALAWIHAHGADGRTPIPDLLDRLDAALRREGLDILSPWDTPVGDLVWPRRHEVAAALSRLRSLQVVGSSRSIH